MSNSQPELLRRSGGICEQGFVENIKMQGMNTNLAGTEFIDNSSDAGATKAHFIIDPNNIIYADNGAGMDHEALVTMNEFNNHPVTDRPTKGVAGVGFKYASAYMCDYGIGDSANAEVLTHTANGDYLKLIIPWSTIFSERWVTDMSEIYPMTESDIEIFLKYLPGDATTGTVLTFPYNETLYNEISKQFLDKTSKNKSEFIKKSKRWSMRIQNETPLEISLVDKNNEPEKVTKLEPYYTDYRNEEKHHEQKYKLDLWTKKHDDGTQTSTFVYYDHEGAAMAFQTRAQKGGIRTEPTQWCSVDKMEEGWQKQSDCIIYSIHTPKNLLYWDPDDPIGSDQMRKNKKQFEPDKRCFGWLRADQRDFATTSVIRNDGLVATCEVDEFKYDKFNGNRAVNAEGHIKNSVILHSSDQISYHTNGNSDLDVLMGICAVKNSTTGDIAHQGLRRTMTLLKNTYMNSLKHKQDKAIKLATEAAAVAAALVEVAVAAALVEDEVKEGEVKEDEEDEVKEGEVKEGEVKEDEVKEGEVKEDEVKGGEEEEEEDEVTITMAKENVQLKKVIVQWQEKEAQWQGKEREYKELIEQLRVELENSK